ncbi:hypothetical protein [Glutamicibacter creatinolyticus]|uniref:hypothetical protein n=1 Tax=Glutamicibacter creatinolyticus TaxID=162496 RepID=UPI00321792D4
MTNYKRGDSFAITDLAASDNDCPASSEQNGFQAFCNLEAGHPGQHVAADANLVVVEVW